MAFLEINQLAKVFADGTTAVDDLNLEVDKGEFIVFLGPSGCGKTTTIRMLAGLEDPSRGSIKLNQRDITHTQPGKRNLSMVFQNYAIWPHMSVQENIAFALKFKGHNGDEIESKVMEVAKLLMIDTLLKRKPAQLSGGQQQRIALARALAVDPLLFLMDEPLSNLDAILRLEMRTEIKRLHREKQATTLFVTHDQSEAMSLADRIVIMKSGKVLQCASPEEIYHHCADTFIASFIGSPPMNLIEVEIQDKQIKHASFELDMPKSIHGPEQSRNLILGIRPENIRQCKAQEAHVQTKVDVLESQGSHAIVTSPVGKQSIKWICEGRSSLKTDQDVSLHFDPNAILLFDGNTQKLIPN